MVMKMAMDYSTRIFSLFGFPYLKLIEKWDEEVYLYVIAKKA